MIGDSEKLQTTSLSLEYGFHVVDRSPTIFDVSDISYISASMT